MKVKRTNFVEFIETIERCGITWLGIDMSELNNGTFQRLDIRRENGDIESVLACITPITYACDGITDIFTIVGEWSPLYKDMVHNNYYPVDFIIELGEYKGKPVYGACWDIEGDNHFEIPTPNEESNYYEEDFDIEQYYHWM